MIKTLLRGALAAAGAAAVTFALTVAPIAAQSDTYPDSNVSSPCRRWVAITPSDTTDLTALPKGVYVGVGGDINMVGVDDAVGASPTLWKNVPTAALTPARPRRIYATSTTATNLVGCF